MVVDESVYDQENIKKELYELAQSRLVLLDKAITTNSSYLRALAELDFSQRRLADAVKEYVEFLDERLLWIRNVTAIDIDKLLSIPKEFALLLSPKDWRDVFQTLTYEALHKPVLIPVFIVVVVLLAWGRKLRTALKATGKRIGKVSADRFLYSVQALLITLLLAVTWRLLLGTIGAELLTSLESSPFSKAVGEGIVTIVPVFLFLRAFYYLCSPYGIAKVHFRWSKVIVNLSRNQIKLVMIVVLPSAFVAVVSIRISTLGGGTSQLAFMVLLLTLAYFISRILHPYRGVLKSYLSRNPRAWLNRLRHVWYLSLIHI